MPYAIWHPSAGGVGGHLFVHLGVGIGRLASHDLTPEPLADGPGQRVAVAATWGR